MESEYPILIILGALLILSPFVKSLMERIGVPALVGYTLLGFLVSAMNQQWSFVTTAFNNVIAVLAQLGVLREMLANRRLILFPIIQPEIAIN